MKLKLEITTREPDVWTQLEWLEHYLALSLIDSLEGTTNCNPTPINYATQRLQLAIKLLRENTNEVREVLSDVLSRFESCISGGNGELEDDKEAIKRAKETIKKLQVKENNA